MFIFAIVTLSNYSHNLNLHIAIIAVFTEDQTCPDSIKNKKIYR